MPDCTSCDGPVSFADVLKQERDYLRPADEPDKPAAPLSALCISGGGIRSATFALGAIQGLADYGLLESFDYLSTVSGGGYIGSWLTAWKQRRAGLPKIIPDLKGSAHPRQGQPDPILHLREYNSYLSPRFGLFSADTWTLVATVARNMFLNWLVLVPLLLFALMLPRLVLSLGKLGDTYQYYGDWLIHLRGILKYGFPVASGLLLAMCVCNTLRYLPGVGGENRTQGDFLRWVLAPLITAATTFIAMDSWFTGGDITEKKAFQTTLDYPAMLWCVLGAVILGLIVWLVYFRGRSAGSEQRPRVERKQVWGMLFALILTGFSTASGAWLLADKLLPRLHWPFYVTVAAPVLLLAFALAVVIFVGLTSKVLEDADREWLSRAGAWLLLYVLIWAAISALVLQVPAWLLQLHTWARSSIAAAGGLGALFAALGSLSSKVKASPKDDVNQQPAIGATLLDLALKLAATIFVIVFLASLVLLTNVLLLDVGMIITAIITRLHMGHAAFAAQDWWNHGSLVENTPVELVVVFALAFLIFGWVMAQCININRFSLHAMYRDRLIRAYLGASNDNPHINQFTGFDESDNLGMSKLTAGLKPFHVVNTTLNLVAGKRLDWQQRKAEPFTISALHCGNYALGYRTSSEYGGKNGISLGTAIALSGAAASPNMGYYSSPVLGFIMTLLNARMGAWLGNPGTAGSSTWNEEGPSSAVQSLVREAFGLTNEDSPYVYLSDGGHFENLGIYEMVKRTCRYIVVLDGAADGDLKFGDLANAVRKIRIDMQVDIKFQEGWEQALRNRDKRWAVATICYNAAGRGEDGHLIYIKPLMCGTEPPDVVGYQAVNLDFPHQSTANQFFNESQTESYRMLGLHTVNEMCAGWNPGQGFYALVNHVQNQKVKKPRAAGAAGAG